MASTEAIEEYRASLADLTCNSKPLINMLTMLAEDHEDCANEIVHVIETHIAKAKPSIKLSVMYLIDSIIKNLPHSNYIPAFTNNITQIFCGVFEKVDEKTRQSLFKLRQTWSDIFPSRKLYMIDVRVNQMDPAWPITAPSKGPGSIHINPKFIKQTSEEPVEKEDQEAEMRQQLIAKQQELLRLQQERLELELAETKAKLEKQKKEVLSTRSDKMDQPIESVTLPAEISILTETLPPIQPTVAPIIPAPKPARPSRDPRLANRDPRLANRDPRRTAHVTPPFQNSSPAQPPVVEVPKHPVNLVNSTPLNPPVENILAQTPALITPLDEPESPTRTPKSPKSSKSKTKTSESKPMVEKSSKDSQLKSEKSKDNKDNKQSSARKKSSPQDKNNSDSSRNLSSSHEKSQPGSGRVLGLGPEKSHSRLAQGVDKADRRSRSSSADSSASSRKEDKRREHDRRDRPYRKRRSGESSGEEDDHRRGQPEKRGKLDVDMHTGKSRTSRSKSPDTAKPDRRGRTNSSKDRDTERDHKDRRPSVNNDKQSSKRTDENDKSSVPGAKSDDPQEKKRSERAQKGKESSKSSAKSARSSKSDPALKNSTKNNKAEGRNSKSKEVTNTDKNIKSKPEPSTTFRIPRKRDSSQKDAAQPDKKAEAPNSKKSRPSAPESSLAASAVDEDISDLFGSEDQDYRQLPPTPTGKGQLLCPPLKSPSSTRWAKFKADHPEEFPFAASEDVDERILPAAVKDIDMRGAGAPRRPLLPPMEERNFPPMMAPPVPPRFVKRPAERRLSIGPDTAIPKELSMQSRGELLQRAERLRLSGEISHHQHQELLAAIGELDDYQREREHIQGRGAGGQNQHSAEDREAMHFPPGDVDLRSLHRRSPPHQQAGRSPPRQRLVRSPPRLRPGMSPPRLRPGMSPPHLRPGMSPPQVGPGRSPPRRGSFDGPPGAPMDIDLRPEHHGRDKDFRRGVGPPQDPRSLPRPRDHPPAVDGEDLNHPGRRGPPRDRSPPPHGHRVEERRLHDGPGPRREKPPHPRSFGSRRDPVIRDRDFRDRRVSFDNQNDPKDPFAIPLPHEDLRWDMDPGMLGFDDHQEVVIDKSVYSLTLGDRPRKIRVFGAHVELFADEIARAIRLNGDIVYSFGEPVKDLNIGAQMCKFFYHGPSRLFWVDGQPHDVRIDAPPKRMILGDKHVLVQIDGRDMMLLIDRIEKGPYGGPPRDLIIENRRFELRFDPPPRKILVDGEQCELLLNKKIPTIMIRGKQHLIAFDGPPRNVLIDGNNYLVPCDSPVRVRLGSRSHVLALGGPAHEVIIDGKWFELKFGGPRREIQLGNRTHMISLEGPPPEVKILAEVPPGYEPPILTDKARKDRPLFSIPQAIMTPGPGQPMPAPGPGQPMPAPGPGQPMPAPGPGQPMPAPGLGQPMHAPGPMPRHPIQGPRHPMPGPGQPMPGQQPPMQDPRLGLPRPEQPMVGPGQPMLRPGQPVLGPGHPIFRPDGPQFNGEFRGNQPDGRTMLPQVIDGQHNQSGQPMPVRLDGPRMEVPGPIPFQMIGVSGGMPRPDLAGSNRPMDGTISLPTLQAQLPQIPISPSILANVSQSLSLLSQMNSGQMISQPVVSSGFPAGVSNVGSQQPMAPSFMTTAGSVLPQSGLTQTTAPGGMPMQFTAGISQPTTTAPLDVSTLFNKLLKTGIISKVEQKPDTEQTSAENPESDEIVDEKIEEFPDISEFRLDKLKKRYNGVIQRLYSGIQCSSCGMRFVIQDTERYREHLDWHFRQNKREKEGIRVAKNRRWFYTASDWIQYEEIEESEERARSSVFERMQEPSTEKPLFNLPSSEVIRCPPASDNQNDVCEICGEPFEQYFDEEEEDWHLRDAVRAGDKTYHPVCYEDATQSTVENTPSPVSSPVVDPLATAKPVPESDANVTQEDVKETVKDVVVETAVKAEETEQKVKTEDEVKQEVDPTAETEAKSITEQSIVAKAESSETMEAMEKAETKEEKMDIS